jgi:hypothetical protein
VTKKDYIALAAALRAVQPSLPNDCIAGLQYRRDVQAVATALRSDNPKFNQDRFFAACGL